MELDAKGAERSSGLTCGAHRMLTVLTQYEENPQLGNPQAEALNRSYRRFQTLANTIDEELVRRLALSFDPPVDLNPAPPCP